MGLLINFIWGLIALALTFLGLLVCPWFPLQACVMELAAISLGVGLIISK